jgi:hypothetical protein
MGSGMCKSLPIRGSLPRIISRKRMQVKKRQKGADEILKKYYRVHNPHVKTPRETNTYVHASNMQYKATVVGCCF